MPENRLLEPGDVLFMQWEEPSDFFILQDGELEILSAPQEFMGLDSSIILDKSVRICTIKGKSMLVGFSGALTDSYISSARALTKCNVVAYNLPSAGIRAFAEKDLSTTVNMLRQIFNNYTIAKNSLNKIQSFCARISQIEDNLCLMYNAISQGEGSDLLNKRADALGETFSFNKGLFPDSFSIDFLIEDRSRFLKKNYNIDFGDNVSADFLDLAKRLLKINPQTLSDVIKSDPEIAISFFSVFSSSINKLQNQIVNLKEKVREKIISFFESEDSPIYFLKSGGMNRWLSTGRVPSDFFKNMIKLIEKLNVVCSELFGDDMSVFSPSYYDFISSLDKSLQTKSTREEDISMEAIPSKEEISAPNVISTGLQKSIYQIFEFSMVDKEFQNRLLKLLNDFKNLKNPLSAESEERKVRRHITQLYWELYKQVFARSKKEKTIPRAVKLMLTFGFLDDTLLTQDEVSELNELARIKEREVSIPILLEYEFLSKIYSGAEEPSITEMGLNYEAFLREQEKYQKKGKALSEREDSDDINLNKTLHEIQQRLASASAVCSGSTATAFPILCSDLIRGSLRSMYQSKSKVEALIKSITDVDFSLFWRETVLKLDSAREIIKEEVFPYFVLLPIAGTKTFMWQELSGTNKKSRGRIMIPILFSGDIEKSLMHTFACFRWELNRSIKGAMWADPIEGGLTGEYFDYVNTFKKNSKLSPEMKEKIALKFKTLRTNRDRFADDYILWVAYEKDGIMKVNNVVREIFFKHMPFRKNIRDQLENMPAFNKFATRYNNIKMREIASYENRFKKYMDENGKYPKPIEDFMNFLKM
ncbi:MAG: hypothetical protein BWY23_00475 [Spirochaetes bacterium ADurb.Bin218]|jgi:hypothetical protein|nr:MAG: hypothetical protein BWY23_00475 [Spirochaetes bacterium ADurb.Bin218]HPD77861.1 hypothetical protein [Spirochaetota bacterium]HRU65294.1 hypothetical protein [Spirochaetota bacterium]